MHKIATISFAFVLLSVVTLSAQTNKKPENNGSKQYSQFTLSNRTFKQVRADKSINKKIEKTLNQKTNKYKIVEEVSEVIYHPLTKRRISLHPIVALKDFGNVKKGSTGGYVEKETNLSQSGNSWIYNDAKVFDNATISDNAIVYQKAFVYENAKVNGSAKVGGYAEVFGSATVEESAEVSGLARADGNSVISNSASVSENAYVTEQSRVEGNAYVYGHAEVSGNAVLKGNAHLLGDAKFYRNNKIIEEGVFANSFLGEPIRN